MDADYPHFTEKQKPEFLANPGSFFCSFICIHLRSSAIAFPSPVLLQNLDQLVMR